MAYRNISSFIEALKKAKDLKVISAPVDPYLEVAEIHRRVIAEQGPALLFTNVKGSSFPIATNLFGTQARVEEAFGHNASDFIATAAKLPEEMIPPSLSKLWGHRDFLKKVPKIGFKNTAAAPVTATCMNPPELSRVPLLTSWIEDGGPFVTLPLVLTQHPQTQVPNLGMYRMQRFSDSELGLHMQIGKGGGFHLAAADKLGVKLPVNVFVGGPPALILSAISPLPENVPELLLASLVLGEKLPVTKHPVSKLPIVAECEFCFSGYCDPKERRPEGPFGDHYGYYSLTHDFPVFHCNAVFHKKNAIYPATVVGKPRQEDFFIGDYLQEMLSPLFPLVMPAVEDLWSYGETGYHSLSTAVVKQRYKREAMASAFRILGEGQLSLTKFLLLIDKKLDIKDFKSVLTYILERVDFRSDLYVFAHLSQDTLDYTGPKLNEGSKGVMLGMGDPIRKLPHQYTGMAPSYTKDIQVYCPGCLVVSVDSYEKTPEVANQICAEECFADWPLIILSDNAQETAGSDEKFLWTTFTRFEPAADIYARQTKLTRFHPELVAPVVIDARMKPGYPGEVLTDDKTKELVDKRWNEYFS